MSAGAASGITVVGASAGSGKTYRLTEIVAQAIDPAGEQRVGLEGLVAVTYTRKAHAELTARIRRTLVGAGAFDEALRLPLAHLGTVHAACLRLLQEFAIDAGLSPNVDVIAEDAGKLLRQSLEATLAPDVRARLDHLADRFKLRYQPTTRRYEWVGPVADIMDLARSSRIAAGDLAAMAVRSADGLLALFPAPEKDGDAIDEALARAIAGASKKLAAAHDGVGKTKAALELLGDAARRQRDGALDWCDWAKLARIASSKPTDELLVPLREVASRYEAHPRLHAELRELTLAVYDAARVGLSSYQTWKSRRGVVDYVDMLDSALEVVSHPRVARELGDRLKLAVVDEFQDTSPIQLALFMKLHGLTKRSVWVGDRKQCIFEYAGADPRLMDDVASWASASGGTPDALRHNYRSRPELVNACSELFAAALARHGFARDEVVVAAKREVPPALAKLPPLGVWTLDTKSAEADASALAAGVGRLLAAASATPVLDRTTKTVRDLRPGDVAVLVATNAEAAALAGALHARGIRAAIARAGLLSMPEGVLVDAALRWLLDASDSLAAAKIDALLGYGGATPDAWLDALLPTARVRAAESLAVDRDDEVAAAVDDAGAVASGWRAALSPVRERLDVLSPAEALDRVLAALDVVHLCARWPDGPQRVANLDALRGVAAGYEARCDQEREAGTVAGMLRYFDDMAAPALRRDEVIASDDQHVPSDDGAVIVSTYHRAKGLEWPVVVMSSLGRKPRRHAFNVSPERYEDTAFDPEAPLANRWIRYWPWPFGPLDTVPLDERAEASDVGQEVARREEKERARLLYVGFTRARDHLVLAVRVKATKATKKLAATTIATCAWLDVLADEAGDALLGLPVGASDGATDAVQIRIGETERLDVPARVWRLKAAARDDEAAPDASAPRRWFARASSSASPTSSTPGEREAPAYRISPSSAADDWPELVMPAMGEIVTLPGAMAVRGAVDNVLGDAVHAFFAADVDGVALDERMARATRLLAAADRASVLRAESLVEASDRLRAFVNARWPGAVWHREVPIEAHVATARGERRVGGIIDLLLETAGGWVLIDHKTFPGRSHGAWRAKIPDFKPQFASYAAALRKLTGAPSRDVRGWVHLPVGGAMVELRT